MSDVTFTRGYGFPRGSGMDYAGYGGLLVNRRFAAPPTRAQRIPFVPEPSIFAKIPALDGLGEDFGTEYYMQYQAPVGGDGSSPAEIAAAAAAGAAGGGVPTGDAMSTGVKVALGLGLAWLIFGR